MEKGVLAGSGFSSGRTKWLAFPSCPDVDQPDEPTPSETLDAEAPDPILIFP